MALLIPFNWNSFFWAYDAVKTVQPVQFVSEVAYWNTELSLCPWIVHYLYLEHVVVLDVKTTPYFRYRNSRNYHWRFVIGLFARTNLFVSNVDKSCFPVTKNLALFHNLSENNCGILEVQGNVLEVHVIGKDCGFILFGLKTDLDQFFMDDSAKNIIIFVKVVDFASWGQGKKIVVLLDGDFHLHEIFLDLCEEQLNLRHVCDHKLYVLVYQLYPLFLNHHCLLNPLHVLLGLDQHCDLFCLTPFFFRFQILSVHLFCRILSTLSLKWALSRWRFLFNRVNWKLLNNKLLFGNWLVFCVLYFLRKLFIRVTGGSSKLFPSLFNQLFFPWKFLLNVSLVLCVEFLLLRLFLALIFCLFFWLLLNQLVILDDLFWFGFLCARLGFRRTGAEVLFSEIFNLLSTILSLLQILLPFNFKV